MSISSTNRKAGPYAGNDVTVAFPFAFKVFSTADVVVYFTSTDGVESVLVLGTNYSISLNSDQDANPGGTVTLTTALATGTKLTLTSSVAELQPVTLTNQGGFYPKVINNALDRATIQIQQLAEKLGRALVWPISSSTGSLPAPVGNTVIGWNAAGTSLINIILSAGSSMVDLAQAAGSSLIGFVQSGVGAATRAVQDKMRESVSVEDFNAKGDGVTDDTLAIQAAIDAVNAAGGGVLLLPKGIYQTSGITLKDGVILKGEGAWASILRTTHATQSIITMKTSAVISDIKLLSSVTRTTGYYVDCQGNGAIIDNCEFGGYYIGVNVGVLGGSIIVGTMIKDCELRDPVTTSGAGAIQFINFSNAEVRNCIITGNAGTQAGFGVRYLNGDTAFLSDTNITLHGKALLVDTGAGYNLYGLTIDSCFFDSSGTVFGGGTVSSAEIVPAGGVWNTKISNTWFGLSVSKFGCYVAPSGAGVVDGLTFTGCEFTKNGDCGLIVVGAGVKNWIVTGGHSGGNTNSGIRVNASSYWTITGHRAGNISARGANNIGITIDAAASDYYIVEGCNLIGNTTSALVDGGTGTNATVANNLGYNGVGAVVGLSVGASPWSYTAGHTPETHYFLGGTLTEIRVDGQIVQNTTAATIQLVPNQVMQTTYTVAPTVIRKRN